MSKGKIAKSIVEMIEEIRNTRGGYEAKRLERAADEVPNLERLYQPEALQGLFTGDNARGIMTMPPGDFERYATPLDYRPTDPKTFMFGELVGSKGQAPKNMTQEEYLRYLANIGGFESVPFLEVNAVKRPRKKPELEITGHEGRHRSRALEMSGQPSSIVQFLPRASLREQFPRRSRDEYIEALNEEMSRYANMVRPQSDFSPTQRIVREKIKLPDVYKGGGPVHKQDGGSIKASPSKPGQEFLGRLGQVAERLGIKLEEAMKIVSQEGNSPVKAFLVNMMVSEPLKSAGTALQDWTGTPRDATEDYPFRRLMTGKGMTAQFDPRLIDVAPAAGVAAGRVARGIKNLPTDVMRAATAAYGPQATASPMDVWHGSPRRFKPSPKNPLGQFDPKMIGTGEGAQAYGYGHYFAESPNVAKKYVPRDPAYEDKLMRMYTQAERRQDYATLEVLEDALIHKTPEELRKLHPEHGALIDKIASIPQKGSLYKVDLPDEQIAKMLDWDKPLSQQDPDVQKAINNMLESGKFDSESVRAIKEYDSPGSVIAQLISSDDPKSSAGVDKSFVSEQLRSYGIPGIKYFDEASRDVGEGTRNFVVFPGGEEMLTIKERMKKGGAVGMQAGGIASRLAKYAKGFEPSKKTEIFIGEKSPMWNASAAGEAVKMEKSGADPVDIWKRTGTFRSPDGALRQEISDVGSKFRGEKEMKELAESMKQQEKDIKTRIAESKAHPDLFPKQLTAAQKELRQQAKSIKERRTMQGGPEWRPHVFNRAEFALEHPELYKAYPELADISVTQGGGGSGMRASFVEGGLGAPGNISVFQGGLSRDPRSSTIHEMQHAIQGIEGWGRGGNPQMAFMHPEASEILNEIRRQALEPMTYEEYAKKAGLESMPLGDAMKQYEDYKKKIPEMAKKLDREFQSQAANLFYSRLAGEAEARAVQERINMSPSERREIFPLSSYDVLPEDVIVKREKKGGQVSLDAMRLATGGMAGGGLRRRGIKEVTKLFEAAQQTRSKAAQEAAGLYHPIGGGVKLSKPVELMKEKVVADPSVKPVPRKIVTLEDLQGGVAIPLVGDRAAAARILKEVEGRKLREPVKLQGGPGFMQTHTFEESPESSAAWASGPGVITRLGGLARKASELAGTEKVYAPYVAMSPTGVDFNTMVADALIGQYDPASLTKKAKKEFLRDVRNYVPDAKKPHIKPGSVLTEDDLNDVESLRAKMLAPDAGPLRKVFVERMGIKEFQEKGFPDVAATRKAITEPELLHEEVGSTGFNIARIDPEGRIVEEPRIPHATYPVQLRGQYFGSLEEPIPFSEFFSGFTESQRLKGKPEKHDWYTFGRSMPIQQLDQEWLDRIMKARKKPREWKNGGPVKKAEGGHITSDDLILEERPL